MMDSIAKQIVEQYTRAHLDKSDPDPDFEVYIVWKCKVLQNWKYLLSPARSTTPGKCAGLWNVLSGRSADWTG